ncbi:hypothetical protein PQX77_006268 [Marasmius sp. AFHP31]|nr:hypothetical protein PQX77_006268 [Marasmius sp. AFHP31]
MFAFQVAFRAQPSSLDTSYVAFSQREDWMIVLQNSDESQIPEENELLRKVCRKLKCVAEGGVIYIERITPAELEFIRQSPELVSSEVDFIPVLLNIREPNGFPEPELQETPITTQKIAFDPECLPSDHSYGNSPVDSSIDYIVQVD